MKQETKIEHLKELIKEKDARIAVLEKEVAVLEQKRWAIDGCGDDTWNL